MSLMDGMLSKVAGNETVQGLAAKIGLSPEQVEQAIAALGKAHASGAASESDTVDSASKQTGLPKDKLQQLLAQIGGEGALSRLTPLLEGEGGGLMGSVSKFL